MRLTDALDHFAHDVRYAARGLRAKPGFTTAVIVTLALGIGANAAMFGIVDRMLLRPPPLMRDPATAHRVYTFLTYRGKESGGGAQFARFLDLSRDTHSFTTTAGYTVNKQAVGAGENSRDMYVAAVSAPFFSFFDAPPALGRYFSRAEDSLPTGQAVVVLSHAFWETQYGERKDVLGSKIEIGSTLFTVIGVAPNGFVGLWPDQPPVAYIPITEYGAAQAVGFKWLDKGEEWYSTYHWGWMQTLARRKPGVTIAQANADLTHAMQLSYLSQLRENKGGGTPIQLTKPRAIAGSIIAERGPHTSSVAKVAVWIGGVALIVLLIACANVANLLLARAFARRREIAVRLAMGVTRRRLLSQLVTESVILALFGGVVGMIIARWGGSVLRTVLLSKTTPAAVLSDPRTLLFAGCAALFVGLITGLAPMHQAMLGTRTLVDDLKSGAREGTYQRSSVRIVLLVAQAALSVVLLVGAGLFVRSLDRLRGARLGYDVDPVALVNLNMRGVTLDSAHAVQLRQRMVEVAKTIPGVTHATLNATLPFWSQWSTNLHVPGIDTVAKLGDFNLNAVSPDFFATFGTRILRGRGFTDGDSPTAPKVAVVSQGMGRALWPGRDAIGQCIRVGADTTPCTTVVGISEDIRQDNITGDSATYIYYLPAAQVAGPQLGLALRTSGDAATFAEGIRRRLQHEMPGVSYVTVTPFSDMVAPQMASWKLGATMFAAFGVLALALAAIGLYSVIAYNVVQRTHEMGVRVALGAQVRDVVLLVVRDGLRFGVVGLIIGAAVARGAAHWVEPLLYQEPASDPIVFGSVTAVLLAVAVAASWLPAQRAARVDPQVALRTD